MIIAGGVFTSHQLAAFNPPPGITLAINKILGIKGGHGDQDEDAKSGRRPGVLFSAALDTAPL